MPVSITQIDAFTAVPFKGNSAAVCMTPEPLATDLMQAIAMEMNLSETAFLTPMTPESGSDSDNQGFSLRWFTPACEVDLCGHATLASAHALWSEGHLAPTAMARFQTRSGELRAQQQDGWIQLDFPTQPVEPIAVSEPLIQALNQAEVVQVARNAVNYLVELRSQTTLTTLQPNFAAMLALDAQGVIVTSRSEDADYDFMSRYFAPAAGIPEDPVTGSSHCSLAPYWQTKLGKDHFIAYQASARGGVLKLQTAGDRVYISGQAVTVLRGELYL